MKKIWNSEENKKIQGSLSKISTYKSMDIYIIVKSVLCLIKKIQHRKIKNHTWVSMPVTLDVVNSQEANSKTGKVLSNKNKRALLFI